MCLKCILLLFCYICCCASYVEEVVISPTYSVRQVGEDFTLLCKVSYPIYSCRMEIGSKVYILKPEAVHDNVTYSGKGFKFGECGAYIRNVTQDMQGSITCFVPAQNVKIDIQSSMVLVVGSVESGTGSIVGIVVAVLILLIGVSLGVFAFATDRWCFAGKACLHTKNLDEFNTKNVMRHVPSRLSPPGNKFDSVHPCGKNERKALERTTVGIERVTDKVIYAELALAEQNGGGRLPPPSSEYAEIAHIRHKHRPN